MHTDNCKDKVDLPGTYMQDLDKSELSEIMLLRRLIEVKSHPCLTAIDWTDSFATIECFKTKPCGELTDCNDDGRNSLTPVVMMI